MDDTRDGASCSEKADGIPILRPSSGFLVFEFSSSAEVCESVLLLIWYTLAVGSRQFCAFQTFLELPGLAVSLLKHLQAMSAHSELAVTKPTVSNELA